MTTETNDLTVALQATTMLIDFHAGFWDAKRTDHEATAKVRRDAEASGDVGLFKKNILVGADKEYKAACTLVRKARQTFYDMTLPWGTHGAVRGPRLLPVRKFDEFITTMGLLRRDVAKAVDAFIAAYEGSKEKARGSLGALYNPADYPPGETLRSAFYLSIEFEPIPDGANFGGLPESTLERLRSNVVTTHAARMEGAILDAFNQVSEAMGRVVATLGDEDKRFRDSLVGNVQEVAEKLEVFNVTGDARMATLHRELVASFGALTAKEIRGNTEIRKAAVADAKTILDKLSSYGV